LSSSASRFSPSCRFSPFDHLPKIKSRLRFSCSCSSTTNSLYCGTSFLSSLQSVRANRLANTSLPASTRFLTPLLGRYRAVRYEKQAPDASESQNTQPVLCPRSGCKNLLCCYRRDQGKSLSCTTFYPHSQSVIYLDPVNSSFLCVDNGDLIGKHC
jgi:hypothetical protein